jgi:DNA-binding Lrp family transcriptional regulator
MTLAWVFVECAKGLASSAEQSVKQVQGVLEAHMVNGGTDYDLVLKVQTDDERQFKQAITTLKRVVGVMAVATCIVYGGVQ